MDMEYTVGSHCVVAKGIKIWPPNSRVECLELENTGGSEDSKFIPLDHPFFEEVEININQIKRLGFPKNFQFLNKYGKALCESKYNTKLDSHWYKEKKGNSKQEN